tara:strand:+ start:791 stop:997 length:207 start_codon:yes stop_codon:yes gene_type:complete
MYTAFMMISVYGWLITVESERNFKSSAQCHQYIATSLSNLTNDFVEYTGFGIKDMRCRLIEEENERKQ